VTDVSFAISPVAFNHGFYAVDVTYTFRAQIEAYEAAGAAPTVVYGTSSLPWLNATGDIAKLTSVTSIQVLLIYAAAFITVWSAWLNVNARSSRQSCDEHESNTRIASIHIASLKGLPLKSLIVSPPINQIMEVFLLRYILFGKRLLCA